MKKTLWLLACFGILSSNACYKQNDTYKAHVQGIIVNNYDSKPIPNADVHFVQLVGSPGTDGGYKQLDSTKSDNLGHFRFDYIGTNNVQYGVRAKHPKYYFVPYSVSYTNFPSRLITDSLVVGLPPKSFFKVFLKDTSKLENYVGIRFITTFYTPNLDVFKNPLDTTLILETHYENTGFTWYLLYDNNRWGAFNRIPAQCSIPFDTCSLSIKF